MMIQPTQSQSEAKFQIETYPWGVKKIIMEPAIDHRGSFLTLFNQDLEKELGVRFVEHNQSHSVRGVIRGLHSQNPPQAKLVRCVAGRVLDIIFNCELRETKLFVLESYDTWVFIPAGLYHGFAVGTEALVEYLVSEPYHPESQRTIAYNSPAVGVDWARISRELPNFEKFILSEKDQNGEYLE